MKITSTEQLEAYLKSTKAEIDLGSLEQLDGGFANFVWRGTDKCGEKVIIKHAEPYVAKSRGYIGLSVDRMDFENKALDILPEQLGKNVSVHMPKVYHYDVENHVLIMADGGLRNLRVAYPDPSLDIQKVGSELGQWLAHLHQQTTVTDIGDNKTAKTIYCHAYDNLAKVFEEYGHDQSFGHRINEKYGSYLLQADDDTVCHGDFWPGNILLDGNQQLTIVDWEMVRRGCPATDVGQFAAEAYLLQHFSGGKGLLPAFLKGYRGDRRLDDNFLHRVGIHMGVHLSFWPARSRRGTEDETKSVIEFGYKFLHQAAGDDAEWMKDSLLKELVV